MVGKIMEGKGWWRNKTAGKCKKIKIILKHKRKKERNVHSNTRDKSEDCIMDRRMEGEEEGEGHGLVSHIETKAKCCHLKKLT
jgi:hypothetical protein